MEFGAQAEEVGEHPSLASNPFVYEMEEFPEALVLNTSELRALYRRSPNFYELADLVGASEAFVRQTFQRKKYAHTRAKARTRTPRPSF